MQLNRFLAERQPAWDELARLTAQAKGRVHSLHGEEVRRLAALYRSATADLALARRRFPQDPATRRLEDLVGRARALVYGTVTRRSSLTDFFSHGYWRRVRERPAFLLISALLLWGSTLGIGVWAHGHPTEASRVAQISPLSAGVGGGGPTDANRHFGFSRSTAMSSQIFTNNMRVALIAFAGGLTGGLLTAASLVFNGLVVGLVAGVTIRAGNGSILMRLLAPHGFLELSLITVAGAAGLRTGWALVHPGRLRRTESLAREGRAGIEMAVGSAVWLIPCGLVEGYVTPRGLSLPAALTFGIGLAAVFWTLVVWRGRSSSDPAADGA